MKNRLSLIAASISLLALASACTPEAPNMSYQARILECVRDNGFTMLAAHRAGFGPGYAENAISSIQRNAELGVLYAEVDVAESSDGQLYLMHDWTLDRTTTGTGEIRETAWSYISTLSLIDPDGQELNESVPTFADAVRAARDAGVYLNLDLKNVSEQTLVDAIASNQAEDEVIVIAYTVEDAALLHTLNPDLVLSAPNRPQELAAAGVNLDNVYLWLGVGAPDAEQDAALAAQGLEAAAGLFPLESGETALYIDAATTGVEVLSIDDVLTGSRALGGRAALDTQIETCRSAAL